LESNNPVKLPAAGRGDSAKNELKLGILIKMGFIKRKKPVAKKLKALKNSISQLQLTVAKIQEALGRIENRQLRAEANQDLISNEFRAFSQWGEDGIIQFLINNIKIDRKIFVEFGSSNYKESNTRFLLINNNWAGLVIDSNEKCVDRIKNDPIYWQHNLKAIHSFITKRNINDLFRENGILGEIGLLSIDIDGNDYWVWQAIEVISPAIVIVEYNSRYGARKAVTIPYDENFDRSKAHYSMIYYGASLKALFLLAKKKGYSFVGCNSAGCNAFFVRRDLKPDNIREQTVEEGYVAGQFREARDKYGNLDYLSKQEEDEIIATLPLVEVD
jgi:hypothetical protein